ncbi:MAG: ABC transporter ATP-binding protein, partial [Bacilli bacterium]
MKKIVVSLKNINKTFNQGLVDENHVLKGIDLDIYEGDFISVIGGNGAGKSTLLNCIAGSISIDEGSIYLNDQNITRKSLIQRSKYISRVFQDPRMGSATKLTIEENLSVALKRGQKRNLSLGVKKSNRPLFKDKLKDLDLGLEDRLKTEIGLLSGGQRQAITLLMATLVTPTLLLLDEHTAALDPKTSNVVLKITKEIVAKQQISTLMITHNMEDALKYGNRLIMLHEGRKVVDVSGEQKANLSVSKLIELFHQNSGEVLSQDSL